MAFPEGQIKAKCPTKGCGANWELGPEGFWSIIRISAEQRAEEVMKKFIRSMTEAFKKVYNSMKAALKGINLKWLHYYTRSKQKRIRNKYERRILTYMMDSLQTAPLKGSGRRRT